ncbi:hypothetical protein AVEN_219466-1 [Araneus ventricosus]|uniref:Uncharacterized protein n=1 Tax=Araneus ventricosus TaxID=182803 RepID=A0A4Y2BQ71_ARAVE|nr:hypothetical protein AVEN_219466-1 [Araneus ventricosus]
MVTAYTFHKYEFSTKFRINKEDFILDEIHSSFSLWTNPETCSHDTRKDSNCDLAHSIRFGSTFCGSQLDLATRVFIALQLRAALHHLPCLSVGLLHPLSESRMFVFLRGVQIRYYYPFIRQTPYKYDDAEIFELEKFLFGRIFLDKEQ